MPESQDDQFEGRKTTTVQFDLLAHPACLLLPRNVATPHSHETTWQECDGHVADVALQHVAIMDVVSPSNTQTSFNTCVKYTFSA